MIKSIILLQYHTPYIRGTKQGTYYIAPSKYFVLEVRAGTRRLADKS